MTHDELLEKIETILGSYISKYYGNKKDVELRSNIIDSLQALRAVVELHSPVDAVVKYGRNSSELICDFCDDLNWSTEGLDSKDTTYPCPTIQAIEKELG